MPAVGPRPLIGVTTYRQATSWWAWERDAALVPGAYLDVVEASGGEALLLPPPAEGAIRSEADSAEGTDRCRRIVAALDGLVLIGGGDLDAARYGAKVDPRNGGTNSHRDDLETGLVLAALEADLPVLAVCRGMQVLNVALGGDLVQQLPDRIHSTRHQPRAGAFGTNAVLTEVGSTVRRLIGVRAEVLCCHHQAVDRLGASLVVAARSEDGVIEAIESPAHRFVIGVQWHPEEREERPLFEALVDAASDHPSGTTVVSRTEGVRSAAVDPFPGPTTKEHA
jgi:putative glutamine amidotransferase